MKSILCAGALTILSSSVFAQTSDFTLIKELPNTYMGDNIGYYTKVKEHSGGVYISYAEMKSAQTWVHTANITTGGTYVPISDLNESSAGTVWSKEPILVFGGLNDNRLATFDVNAKNIYVKVVNTQTGEKEYLLTPEAGAVKAYENLPWDALGYNDKNASFSLGHSISRDGMVPCDDHIVVKVFTHNSFKRYYNPAIINYSNPDKLNVIVPNFPAYNTSGGEGNSTWSYCGSTESLHLYAKGYMKQDKRLHIDTCVNIMAIVDNQGKVINTFILDMKMPDMKIVAFNKYEEEKGRTAIEFNRNLDCFFASAIAENKSGDMFLIVKRYSFDGKLIWESACKVHKKADWAYNYYGLSYTVHSENKFSVSVSEGGGNGFYYYYDLNTGKMILEKEYKRNDGFAFDGLEKSAVTKIQNFMTTHKDHKKVLGCYKLNDAETFIAFWCSNGSIKLYKFGNG